MRSIQLSYGRFQGSLTAYCTRTYVLSEAQSMVTRMLTAIRGNTSESAVLHAFLKRGYHVMIPFGDGCPFDLVVAAPTCLLVRVQVKTGWSEGGCVALNTHSTDHGQGPGSYRGRADFFGVFFEPMDQVYLVPVGRVGVSECRLRVEPPRNNQRRRVNLAANYCIERWTDDEIEIVVVAPSGDLHTQLAA
jgi:hypothetical protein